MSTEPSAQEHSSDDSSGNQPIQDPAQEASSQPELPFELDLFDLLVCPESRQPLKWVDGRLISTDRETRRCYPVTDGIPIMLIKDSAVLDLDEWDGLMAQQGPVGAGAQAVRLRSGPTQGDEPALPPASPSAD